PAPAPAPASASAPAPAEERRSPPPLASAAAAAAADQPLANQASPAPSTSSPQPTDSRSASPAIDESELARNYTDLTTEISRASAAMKISHTDSPSLDFSQSIAVDRESQEWEMVGEKTDAEADPDEMLAFPENMGWGQTIINAAGGVIAWFRGIDATIHDPQALKVKAMKYEALLGLILNDVNELRKAEAKEPLKMPENKGYDLNYLNAVRDLFELEVLKTLRDGVEANNPGYNAVCFKLYTENDLDSANQALFGLFGLDAPTGGTGVGPGILDRLEAANQKVDKVEASKTTNPVNRWARSLKDKLGFNFSPIGAGNPPQKLFNFRMRNRDISILGFGSPTMQNSNLEAKIDPLFIGYLRELKDQNKVHLYVSNQNTLNEENARNKVIMALAEDPEFKGTFIAMTQSKNTKAYHAKARDGEVRYALSIKTRLHNNFFVTDISKSGCGLSSDLKENPELQAFSTNMLNLFHETLFGNRKELTEAEEKLLIELHYNVLTLKILKDRKVDFVNFTCKDGIDRGMGSLAWFIMMIEFMSGRQEDKGTEEKLMTTFFTRAYWTRKRNILHERIERPLEDMKTLSQITDGFNKVYLALASGFGQPVVEHHKVASDRRAREGVDSAAAAAVPNA
ncbi:MAG: hypothetical protein KDK62_08660, partial [Chlamydiia bacterium]|nr:hypothetical protein [Chlamydiia bacterium]